eukprot:14177228-Ditylum_brightwellii.AAC.1
MFKAAAMARLNQDQCYQEVGRKQLSLKYQIIIAQSNMINALQLFSESSVNDIDDENVKIKRKVTTYSKLNIGL